MSLSYFLICVDLRLVFLGASDVLLNATAGAGEAMALFVDPLGERQIRHLTLTMMLVGALVMSRVCALASFSFFRAAVFAEPTIAEVEEVSSLVHER